MISEWLVQFNNTENQLIITELAKKYSLSREEYVNLINLMIYYYIITDNPNTLEAVSIICDRIAKYKNDISKHQNNFFFKECLSLFLTQQEEKGNLNRIENFLNQGFLFHSFNSAFFPLINTQGLMSEEKPWDLEEVERVRKIFLKNSNKNIFGLYQGKEKTPIFFANNLISSAYYGISSPTFFRKFIENKNKYFNIFSNRDYEMAKESIKELCEGLNENDRAIVFSFFQKYWDFFAEDNLPYVAISTKEKLNIENTIPSKLPNEKETDYILRRILETKNEMLHINISRNLLEIFSYQTFSFSTYTNKKAYS